MKPTGIVLVVLGVLSLIAAFVVPGVGAGIAVGKVNDTNSTTYGEGVITQLLNTGKLVATPETPYDTDVPVSSTRVTQADKAAMDQQDAKDAGATIFNTTSTTVRTDTNAELSTGKAVFAFDPANSQLINCCGASLGDNTNVNFSGVMPLKFPFGSPQGDIQLFNTTLQTPVTATYKGSVEKYGMTLYEYTQSIPPTQTPAKPTEIPAALAAGVVGKLAPTLADKVPAEGSISLYEWYTAENSFLVEPLSGQIVDGVINDKTTFRLDGGDTDIVTKVAAKAGSAKVEEGAAEIKSSSDLLKYVALAPIVFGILGVILLVVGIILIVVGGRRKKAAATPAT